MGDADGDARRENRRRFLDFLDQDFGQGTYASRVRTMVESGRTRLVVNLNHLRAFDADFTRRFFDPCKADLRLPILQDAARSTGFHSCI